MRIRCTVLQKFTFGLKQIELNYNRKIEVNPFLADFSILKIFSIPAHTQSHNSSRMILPISNVETFLENYWSKFSFGFGLGSVISSRTQVGL